MASKTWPQWLDYIPTLTATTTNPTLGSGSVVDGRYARIGDTVIGWAQITFGTSGTAAGSGDYRISLPVTPRNEGSAVCGAGFLRDSSTGNKYGRTVNLDAGNQWCFMRTDADGTSNAVDHDSPIAWSASDHISIQFVYEAAV